MITRRNPLREAAFADDEKQAVLQVLKSGWLAMGETAQAFDREVTLPLYPSRKTEDVAYVVDPVREVLASSRVAQAAQGEMARERWA